MHNHLKDLMQDPNFVKKQIIKIFKGKPQKQILNMIIESKGKYLL